MSLHSVSWNYQRTVCLYSNENEKESRRRVEMNEKRQAKAQAHDFKIIREHSALNVSRMEYEIELNSY
jgi:hypothetical protein